MSGMPAISEHFSEGKVYASGAGQRMLPILDRGDAVIDEACWTAPHRNVTAFKAEPAHWIGAAFAAPQKYGGQAGRDSGQMGPRVVIRPWPGQTQAVAPD